MKRVISVFVSALLLSACAGTVGAEVTEKNMLINTGSVRRYAPRELYGLNLEWAVGVNDTIQYKNDEGKVLLRPDFPEVMGGLLSFTRKAGSSSSFFKWKESIGDISERGQQTLWYSTNKVYEGIGEWLEYITKGAENPSICYTVNIYGTDTYENLADIVEFMVSDGSVNYNGGINWGEVRKSYGYTEPIDVFCWEIGNELDWEDGNLTTEQYIERGRAAIDIIKNIDPDAKISIQAATDSWNRSDYSQNWNRAVLRALGDMTDYLSVHFYYPADFTMRADPAIEAIKRDIVEITGSDRIKLYFSEQAVAPNSYSYNKQSPYDYMLPHTIWGATGLAEWYMRTWFDSSVVAASNHSLNSSVWSIVYCDEDGNVKLSSTGEVIKTFIEYGVGDVLETDCDGFDKNTASIISGGAVRGADGEITLFLLNRSETDDAVFNLKFSEGNYRIKHIRTVHGDVKSADNFYRSGEQWAYNNPDRVTVSEEDSAKGAKADSITVRPLTLSAVTLEKIN